jgi:hypothetical protein
LRHVFFVAQRVLIDPDKGLTDLVQQLGDDSKRLLSDEVRLAKLETADSLHRAAHGALRLGVAFGIGVVTLVALTLFLATGIGELANGHMWIGAIVTAVAEIAIGYWLLRRGLRLFKSASYTLPETRAGLRVLKGS